MIDHRLAYFRFSGCFRANQVAGYVTMPASTEPESITFGELGGMINHAVAENDMLRRDLPEVHRRLAELEITIGGVATPQNVLRSQTTPKAQTPEDFAK